MFCITWITAVHFITFCIYFALAVLMVNDGLKDLTRRYLFIILALLSIGSINRMLLQNPCTNPEFASNVNTYFGFAWRGLSVFTLLFIVVFSGFFSKKAGKITAVFAAAYFITAFFLHVNGHANVVIKKDFGFMTAMREDGWGKGMSVIEDTCDYLAVALLLASAIFNIDIIRKRQSIIMFAGIALSVLFVHGFKLINHGFFTNADNVSVLPGFISVVVAMRIYGLAESTRAAAHASVFGASFEMMAFLNAAGKIEDANPAFRAICPECFSSGNKPLLGDLLGADEAVKILHRLGETGELKGYDICVDAQGKVIQGLLSGHVMKKAGVIYGYVLMIMDITRIKEAEEELISYRDHLEEMIKERTKELDEANASLRIRVRTSEDFIKASHHDIMEPIRAISKMLQLAIKRDGTMNPETMSLINDSVKYTGRLESLIYDIREYTAIEGGRETHRNFSLKEAVDEALMEMQSMIASAGAKVETDADAEVYGNKRQIKQLMSELVENSVRFRSEDPPVIKISALKKGASVIVSVSDNGKGIPEEYKERVFGAFERLHAREVYEGNGIGLAICAKIMELHGKRIWAEKGVRKGTVISFEMEG